MSENLKIRKFKIEDYENLIELWKRAGLPYKPEGRDRKDKIKKELERGIAIFLVAEINGKIAGSIIGTHDGRKGWINRLAVDPEYRRQGIAKKLIEEVEKKLYKEGIEIIACLIEDWNKSSMEFFKRMGYKEHKDIIYFTKRKYEEV
jgi:ribosomal protein S18 acetylase RimI-like enzyme